MNHFLYAYKDDGRDGRELRYSLRSLQTNLVTTEKIGITIVGDIPTWLDGPNVRYVERPQTGGDAVKVHNIMSSVLAGVKALRANGIDACTYMDDDFMLLEPSFGAPLTYSKNWSDYIRDARRLRTDGVGWYIEAAERTDAILSLRTGRTLAFEGHRPLPVDVTMADRILSTLVDRDPKEGVFWRSTYGNMAMLGRDIRWAPDVKVGKSWPVGSSWVSTDQRDWDTAKTRLERWLSKPSIWER